MKSDCQGTVQQYVSDTLALERYILNAVKRQVNDEKLEKFPEAEQLIRSAEEVLTHNVEHMDKHLDSLGGDAMSTVKEIVAGAAGMVTGFYNSIRTDPVSKMLRDDYTTLNLAAISYTMLHTTCLALGDQKTADIAQVHLSNLTPIIIKINKVVPMVVAEELIDECEGVNTSVGEQAVLKTQEAWSLEQTAPA